MSPFAAGAATPGVPAGAAPGTAAAEADDAVVGSASSVDGSAPAGETPVGETAASVDGSAPGRTPADADEHASLGTAFGAAASSFCFFASGAVIAVLPYLFGLEGLTAVIVAALAVGVALLGTGAVVGLLSGASPLKRALRQLAIGFGAAAVTYLLGLLFGTGAG
nr:hypothetical protein GCM10025699_41100 [Microbacterium flavescens]